MNAADDEELRGEDGGLGLADTLPPTRARSTREVVDGQVILTKVDVDGTTWRGVRPQGAPLDVATSWEVTEVGDYWGPVRRVKLGPASLGPFEGPKDPPPDPRRARG